MKLSLHKIMYVLMMGALIIDMATGVIMINNPEASVTPGLLYKLVVMAILLYFVPKLNILVFVLNVILITTTIMVTIVEPYSSISSNLIAVIKIGMFCSFYFYLIYGIEKDKINKNTIYKIAKFSFLTISVNQFLGLLGFGKPTYLLYGVPVGTSGFFFEHNAIGIVLLIVASIIYLHIRSSASRLKLLMFCLITMFLGFSFATKVGIIGGITLLFILLFERFKKAVPVVLVLFSIIVFVNWGLIQKTGQVAKVIDDYEKNSSEGLLSGRYDRFEKGVYTYSNKFNLRQKIVGIGAYAMVNDQKLGETAEMDFLDILRTNGIVGFSLIYGSFFYIIILVYKNYQRSKNSEVLIVLFLNFLFLVVSSLAGHLFGSGTVGFFWAMLNAYVFVKYNTTISEEKKDIVLIK